MREYMATLNNALRFKYGELNNENPDLQALHNKISPKLLTGLERVSVHYQQQSEYLVGQTINLQNLAFFLAMASLLSVGAILLKPLVENLTKATLKAREEKAFADNVINTAETLIVGINEQENIVLFNSYAEELSGWGEEEVMNSNFFDKFIPEQSQIILKTLFNDMMQGEIEFADEVETELRVQTGELLNIVWHTTVVRSQKNHQPLMFLATGLDITERKLAEQKAQEANLQMEVLNVRLTSEIDLAATLQQSILPDPNIDLPGLMGKANLQTSSEVGGDFYDYFKVGGHQSVLMVGDVSGHGVAAGTMVSAAKAGLYPLVHEGISSPAEILHALNETMLATTQQSLLMTMACLSLDASNGKLAFANAGHVLPYLWHRELQQWEMLEASGLPLGKSIDADYRTSAIETTMAVGDRLFLFTDGVVEEESPSGEPFGYDRLEQLLNECGDLNPDAFRDKLMSALSQHCESQDFEDDVTILVVNHSDRVELAAATESEASDIIRITETLYRQGDRPVPRVPREFVVFIAEQEYADLLPRFSADGLCRILPKHDDFCMQIGWDHLLNQHHETPDDDLFALLPRASLQRQFLLNHTDDKLFIMEEIQSWLSDQGVVSNDHLESLVVILDEMIENSLYAAPRDGKGVPYFEKGVSRELSEIDEVRIDIVLSDNKLGLMITDNWGTLTPAVFLRNIARAMEGGVDAGVGGAGLYMMWRLSDYFQIRVYPQQRTQVTTLWDLNRQVNMDTSSGFQFLHHSDLDSSNQVGT
jgi:PAS domain S-box-containing protein